MSVRNAPGEFSRGAFFVVVAMTLAAGCDRASAADCELPGPGETVRVARVIDGDTLALADGRHVRMLGINAPELGHQGAADEPLARAAKTALEQLLGADHRTGNTDATVSLHVDRQRLDHYGRLLAHISRGGRNLERELLRKGLAYHVVIPPNMVLADCLRTAERNARTARVGLWSPSAPDPTMSTAIAHGGYQRVRGRVERVLLGDIWWIEFTGGLRAVIYPEHQQYWDRRTLAAWRGRSVEVRGWVYRSRRGDWRLRLPTPDAVLTPAR
jgi:endonuclease YncB( thermonuclease family)